MPIKPVLQALVLADHIYVDKLTSKMIIAGTFNQLFTKKFPNVLNRTTFAYICLTDVRGTVPLTLRYRDLSTSELLMESPTVEVESRNPLASVEVVVEVPQFPMPHEGAFAFELHADDEPLGSLRINVSHSPEDSEEKGESE